jgi:phosphohistidine phosphatase
MKTVYLFRHAKAQSKDIGVPDFERTITDKGRRVTREMAQRAREKQIIPDLLISSPASRAIETACIVADVYGWEPDVIRTEALLYDASDGESLFDMVQGLDADQRSVMVFGHNPTFNEFASAMIPDFSGNISKSGVVGACFEVDTWRMVGPGKGRLCVRMNPKDFD